MAARPSDRNIVVSPAELWQQRKRAEVKAFADWLRISYHANCEDTVPFAETDIAETFVKLATIVELPFVEFKEAWKVQTDSILKDQEDGVVKACKLIFEDTLEAIMDLKPIDENPGQLIAETVINTVPE
eukprot:GEMP01085147.1.p1 GENE.GEMP01085147.1~~GEMP01085147.1.p1  ORF type:complete len:129 (+),score=15.04 GEMP01085147.1:26-412(+)